MSLPSERTMPVTVARYHPLLRAWLVTLPGNIELPARDTVEAEALRDKYASGSAIRYVRDAFRAEAVEHRDPPSGSPGLSPERTTG